ncbi:zinc-finger domain-containing protein [Ectobacillus ponti]|uniref:Zinc-finger domain-containing protein n=1 Tax=Ectobacillus ponti TaxID=2961894 RepID=A0AA41X9G1_9BACI|nr:zinc-finger domain-containing protein [Ectobacillus ponti]
MSRKQLITEVHNLIEAYCEGCFLNRQLRHDHSRRYAQNFCIRQCTVGEKLQQYGQLLSGGET